MSDNFGINISKEDASEFTRLLLGSVKRLTQLEQYNDFIRLQAIDDPFKFIADTERHVDTLEQLDRNKGNFHLIIHDVNASGRENKLGAIKTLRAMFGWGLADAKASVEALPSFGINKGEPYKIVTPAYENPETIKETVSWREFSAGSSFFVYEIARLPPGTKASTPFVNKT